MVFTQLQQPISPPGWEFLGRRRKGRIHHYENSGSSSDFCLDPALDQSGFYMTSCKAGVRKGDLVRINEGQEFSEYRVETIEFYSDPADMWIAKLHMV
mgnify:CR=1 FL=1